VRTEYVEDLNGTREAVLVMHGHFKLRRECPIPGGTCPTGDPTARLLVVDLGLPTNRDSVMGFQTESPAQDAALTAAKNASPLFKIFNDFLNLAIGCSIPSGGASSRAIAAACTTNYTRTRRGTQITFRERWPLLTLRNGHWPPGTKIGGWIVTIGSAGRVESIRKWGDTPPQLSK
jgi:hypothetical protein